MPKGAGKKILLVLQLLSRSLDSLRGTALKARLGIFMITAVMLASPVHAEFVTGNELYQWGKEFKRSDTTSWIEAGAYMGYIQAISDAFDDVMFCLPGNATVGQSSDVVMRYLEAHPEKRHYTADSLAGAALSEAFPCN
jgi:hypothetical protein